MKENKVRATCGSILRRERELHNWSQQELVQQILKLCARDKEYPALTTKTIGRWERGEYRPSPYYRKHLCQLFGRNAIQLGFLENWQSLEQTSVSEVLPGKKKR
jgi:transcriptional regulator with XRE-family HTH domain